MNIENLKQLADQHDDTAIALIKADKYLDAIQSWHQRVDACQAIIAAGDANYIDQLGRTYVNLGSCFIFLEDHARAIEHFQTVVALWRLDDAHPFHARPQDIVDLRVNLSSAYAMQTRPNLALEQLTIAEQFLENTQNSAAPFPECDYLDHLHLVVKQIAWIHYRAGHWREGAKRYQEASVIAEKKWRGLGEGNADLVRSIQLTAAWHRGNLARCLQSLGDYTAAALEFEAAQAGFAKLLGSIITADDATDWAELAHLHLDSSNVQQKLDVQLASSRTALRIYQQLVVIGYDAAFKYIPRARHNIGSTLMRLGQLSAAKAELETALSELADRNLANQLSTATERVKILTTLATIRAKLGEANVDLPDCSLPDESDESPLIKLVSGNNAALRLWNQGYRELAIAKLQDVISANTQPTPESTAEHWAAWALCKRSLGNWLSRSDGGAESSRQQLAEALAIYEKLGEHGSPRFQQELVNTKNAIAGNLLDTGHLSEALSAWRALWHNVNKAHFEDDFGRTHILGSILRNMGLVSARQGKVHHAIRYQILALQYFLKLEQTAPEEFAPKVLEIRLTIGDLLKSHGKVAQAVPHFEAAVIGFEKLRGLGRAGYCLEEAIARETLGLGYLERRSDGDTFLARLQFISALEIHAEIDSTLYPEAPLASVFTATALARLAEERWFDFLQAFDGEPIPLMLECRGDLLKAFAVLTKIGLLQNHRNRLRAFDAVAGLLAHLVYRWPGFMGMQMGMPSDAVDAVSLWLLGQVGNLLTHRSPQKLVEEYDKTVNGILTVIFIALRYIGTPKSLAQYFVFTQGLRAQRQAADLWQHSGEEELRALSALYVKLEALDVELGSCQAICRQKRSAQRGVLGIGAGSGVSGLR